jgi:hypothetical protein
MRIEGAVQRRRLPDGRTERVYISNRGIRTVIRDDDHLLELEQADRESEAGPHQPRFVMVPSAGGGTEARVFLPGLNRPGQQTLLTRLSLLPPGVFQSAILPGLGYAEHHLVYRYTFYPLPNDQIVDRNLLHLALIADFGPQRPGVLYFVARASTWAGVAFVIHVIPGLHELLPYLRRKSRGDTHYPAISPTMPISEVTVQRLYSIQDDPLQGNTTNYVRAAVFGVKSFEGVSDIHGMAIDQARNRLVVLDNRSIVRYPLLGTRGATTARLGDGIRFYDFDRTRDRDAFVSSAGGESLVKRTGLIQNLGPAFIGLADVGLKIDQTTGEIFFLQIAEGGEFRMHVLDGDNPREIRSFVVDDPRVAQGGITTFDVHRGVIALLYTGGLVDFYSSQTGRRLSRHLLQTQNFVYTSIAFVSDDHEVAIGRSDRIITFLVRPVRSLQDIEPHAPA